MKITSTFLAISLFTALPVSVGFAQQPAATAAAPAAVNSDMADGEIRKIDKDSKKITIKHGEIKNLDMPPMTMVFQVKDATWLDKLQPADRIKFKAISDGGKYTVVELQILK